MTMDSVDTVYSACSTELCPGKPSLLACGTYQIAEDDSVERNPDNPATKRLGRCLLYDTSEGKLRETQRFDQAAILDMKWTMLNNQQVLAIAGAEGQVSLHRLNLEQKLDPLISITCSQSKNLCLSLDWSNRRDSSIEPELAVSISDGSVSIYSGQEFEQSDSWHAHDFEPWIVAWDCWNNQTLWTGGDDCRLKAWDRRQGFSSPSSMNKRFDGGVTTIQSHALKENLLAVGSYDSRLRIFDKRNMTQPLTETDVGGGIWRVKWHATDANRILVACMHDGFKVLSCDTSEEQPSIVNIDKRFDEHESLAYGADWLGPKQDGHTLIASCSFYDHRLCIWNDAP